MADTSPAPAGNSVRANLMVVVAFLGLLACLAAGVTLALSPAPATQQGGVVLGLLVAVTSAFANALMTAFNYEFGSSKSAQTAQTFALTAARRE